MKLETAVVRAWRLLRRSIATAALPAGASLRIGDPSSNEPATSSAPTMNFWEM